MNPRDREEFRSYVLSSQRRHLRTAYLLTGDRGEAEDLVQTALVRLAVHWTRVRQREALDGWVRRTMVNAQISWWRRRRPAVVSTAELVDQPAGPAPRGPAGPEVRLVLWAALQELPARQRAAVVLRFWEDLSEAEAAAVLGCSVGTVKSQTSRALARLRQRAGRNGLLDLHLPSPTRRLTDPEELPC